MNTWHLLLVKYTYHVVEIRKHKTARGRIPFGEGINNLRDRQAAARIATRLTRLGMGNEGDWKSVGAGVRELRISVGKGYRIYYAWEDEAIVLLLCGGDKSSQQQDIKQAAEYWENYHE